jgi:twinkle protein
MGKTTLRSALASHIITAHGQKVFMAAPEETNKKTWQLVCGQASGRIFHDPDVPFDYEAYDGASKLIGDNLYLLNLYQHMGWDSLRSDIIASANEGCKSIFIDPITNLTNGISSGEANTALQEISQELASIALDMQLTIWMFCHLKAPDSGNPHERGGRVMSNQFAGSRAMMRSCHMMMGLEGNKDPDLPEEVRNQRRLVILEDREFGASGYVNLYYNPVRGLYTEIKNER